MRLVAQLDCAVSSGMSGKSQERASVSSHEAVPRLHIPHSNCDGLPSTHAQVPQSMVLPHPSSCMPQATPSESQVCDEHRSDAASGMSSVDMSGVVSDMSLGVWVPGSSGGRVHPVARIVNSAISARVRFDVMMVSVFLFCAFALCN